MLESAKDLTIEAAVSASSRLTDTPSSLRPQEISKLLNSRLDRDVLNGMKCVISLISRGEDGLTHFADVVKNVTSSNLKIKYLVLIYLTRYAEVQPDTALLSINSIQKSLSDKNASSRTTAIRSLAGIRIPEISSLLLLCIKRTVTDPTPWVRAGTAIAIAKAYEIPNINRKQLFEYLCQLIADSDPLVVGSAIKAYYKIKVELNNNRKKWDPIHGNFRRFAEIMSQLDEWAQCYLIEILVEYSRKFLPRPKLYLRSEENQVINLPDDYSDIPFPVYDVSMDSDLELFLNSLKVLVYSRSEFVILSISKAIYLLAPPLTFKHFKLNAALCKLATGSKNNQISLFALQTISMVSSHDKSIFGQYYKKFYLFPSDTIPIATCKLQILSSLISENNVKIILDELKYYALNSNNHLLIAKEAIKAIGCCSQISPYWNEKILKWCSKQIKRTGGGILNELLTVTRYLIQQKQSQSTVHNSEDVKQDIMKTTYRLSLILKDDEVNLESDAKASIIWIIGEFTGVAQNTIAPDVMRILIKNFVKEAEKVRYEILVLSAKVFSIELDNFKNENREDDTEAMLSFLENNIISKMFQHVLQLAKYDQSYDTRDRARLFHVLLNTGSSQSQLASLFLQVPKPVPTITSSTELGSKEFKSLHSALVDYFKANDWTSDESSLPPSSIRKQTQIRTNNLSNSGGNVTSVSSAKSRSGSPPIISNHAISSASYHNRNNLPETKETYRLQSLDEFFGNEDEEESGEELESSSEEEEDYEEESEESDDDNEEEEEEGDEVEEEGKNEENEQKVNEDGGVDNYSTSDESDVDSQKNFIQHQ